MQVNGLGAMLVLGLAFFAYIGWFYYRPLCRQLSYENAQLRRTMENAVLVHERNHPIFDWTMDHKPNPVKEARMKERLDRMYEGWYQ